MSISADLHSPAQASRQAFKQVFKLVSEPKTDLALAKGVSTKE